MPTYPIKMRNDFCAFILTHGRPENVRTYKSLKVSGYTGPVYLIIDDEDPTADAYYRKFGAANVIKFSKSEIAKTFDEADNFENRKAIVYARNACFEIARKLGYKYFVQLDDDYTSFLYRNIDGGKTIRSIDRIFEAFVEYLEKTSITTVAFAQGGDFIGGYDDEKPKVKRKAMNSFFCSVDREFQFLGRINEDVNTYVRLGGLGHVFLTVMHIQLNQFATQSNAGGMTDLYKSSGTYVKSFYTILFNPSSVRIITMGRSNRRIHHAIDWNATVPQIINERHKK